MVTEKYSSEYQASTTSRKKKMEEIQFLIGSKESWGRAPPSLKSWLRR